MAGARRTRRSVAYEFASSFSFPPENLLTAVAPDLFGDMSRVAYWGRGYLWEMCLFGGIAGLLLAVYGGMQADRRLRAQAVTMSGICVVLALGKYTPLYAVLYRYLPCFGQFRGCSKFIFIASLFITILAAAGLDRLLRDGKRTIPAAAAALLLAAACVGAAAVIRSAPGEEAWRRILHLTAATGETTLDAAAVTAAAFGEQSNTFAANRLGIASLTAVLISLLLVLRRRGPAAAYAVILIGVVEMFVFARQHRPTFDIRTLALPELRNFVAAHPGDYRVLATGRPNAAMDIAGCYNMDGYDANLLRRYAEFVAVTQNGDPDRVTSYLNIETLHPAFTLLRCKYMVTLDGDGRTRVEGAPRTLPHVSLVDAYTILKDRDDILALVTRGDFHPGEQVVLEAQPEPPPVPGGAAGSVAVVATAAGSITIEAMLSRPAILLVSDLYSRGWRAVAAPGSSQQRYTLMAADYILQAVPLSAGRHRLTIEYAPAGFRTGRWISAGTLVSLVFAAGAAVRRRKKEGDGSG
jgi:hypothetical protein